jgi:hypothetical protein
MKKPKWAKSLDKKMLQHVKDVSETGRASLRVAKENADNPHCLECRCVGTRLRLNGVL